MSIGSDPIVLCEEKGVNRMRLTLADCTAIAVGVAGKSAGGDGNDVTVCVIPW